MIYQPPSNDARDDRDKAVQRGHHAEYAAQAGAFIVDHELVVLGD
jgi:hypothetical protein